jgi:hypothetical protein
MEKLTPGLRVIVAGKGDAPGGLLPPHAGKNKNKEMAMTIHAKEPKRNLPMHPLVASRLIHERALPMEWKNRSVVAADGFSKLSRREARLGAVVNAPLRFRQWDAKRWVDDVSTQLL